MKSAEEWAKDFPGDVYRIDDPRPLEFIRAIQDETILSAIAVLRRVAKEWSPGPMDGHFDHCATIEDFEPALRALASAAETRGAR